jgi:hypothetical protein
MANLAECGAIGSSIAIADQNQRVSIDGGQLIIP